MRFGGRTITEVILCLSQGPHSLSQIHPFHLRMAHGASAFWHLGAIST